MAYTPITNFDVGQIPDTNNPTTFHSDATYVFSHMASQVIPGINGAIDWMNAALPGDVQTIIDGLANVQGGRLLNIQSFTAPGAFTYTPTPGTKMALAKLIGAGGGGGGADGDNDNNGGAGAGGASGGTLWVLFTVNDGDTYSGVIGAGGTAGTQSANGGTGGDTTFANGAASKLDLSVAGGLGGESVDNDNTNTSSGGLAPATSTQTGTDLLWSVFSRGSDGGNGMMISKQDVTGFGSANGGNGGPSSVGGGGRGLDTDNTGASFNGRDGVKGGGGGGAVALDITSAATGGLGGDGYGEIWEFS